MRIRRSGFRTFLLLAAALVATTARIEAARGQEQQATEIQVSGISFVADSSTTPARLLAQVRLSVERGVNLDGVLLPLGDDNSIDPSLIGLWKVRCEDATDLQQPLRVSQTAYAVMPRQSSRGNDLSEVEIVQFVVTDGVLRPDDCLEVRVTGATSLDGTSLPPAESEGKYPAQIAKPEVRASVIGARVLEYIVVEASAPLIASEEVRLFEVTRLADGREQLRPIALADVTHPRLASSDPSLNNNLHLWPRERFRAGKNYRLRVTGLETMLEGVSVQQPEDYAGMLLTPPKGKDDATYFARFFWEIQEDTKPVFTIDFKADPTSTYIGRGWWFDPVALINIGNEASDKSAKAKTKNQIIGEGVFGNFWNRPGDPAFAGGMMGLAGRVESDRDFDKLNLMFVPSFAPELVGWVRPRERALNPDEIVDLSALPRYGYGFQMAYAAELGRSEATNDGLLENKAKTQQVNVPDHNIARMHARFRIFFEASSLLFEVVDDLRLLMADEFVGVAEASTDTVSIRTVDELRNYLTVSVGWVIDQDQRFVLGLTYETGEAPPKYGRVEVGRITFTFKY